MNTFAYFDSTHEFPEEIIIAAQMNTYKILGKNDFSTDLADQYIPPFICANARSFLNQALEQAPDWEGIAIAHGKDGIDLEIYEIIKKVGADLITDQRRRILKYLWDQRAFQKSDVWRTTSDVSESIAMPGRTSLITLEDLMTAGVLNRKKEYPDVERSAWIWQIKNQMHSWMSYSEIFEKS